MMSGPRVLSASSEHYVDGLLEYAKRVLMFGTTNGILKDSDLADRIAKVERLGRRTAGEQVVVELNNALVEIANTLPTETRIALRPRAWFQGPEWNSSTLAKLSLIALSMLLMIATGRMTFVHNKGVTIAQELDNLSLVDPERTLNQLVWTIAQANGQMQVAGEDAETEFELARNAQQTALFDLKNLSDRVQRSFSASSTFLSHEANFPIPPMRTIYCRWFTASETLSPNEVCGSPIAGSSRGMPTDLCLENFEPSQPIITVASASTSDQSTYLPMFKQQMAIAERDLYCYGHLKMPLGNIPALRPSIPLIKEKIELYAFWFLPALYGAMGVVIYQLRRVLDPMRPTHPWYRFAHRIVLGGLAGIVLGWFFAPDSQIGTQFADIGFGLFGLAFLLGYSIDVFFALLDRLVSTTVGTIERFGDSRPS